MHIKIDYYSLMVQQQEFQTVGWKTPNRKKSENPSFQYPMGGTYCCSCFVLPCCFIGNGTENRCPCWIPPGGTRAKKAWFPTMAGNTYCAGKVAGAITSTIGFVVVANKRKRESEWESNSDDETLDNTHMCVASSGFFPPSPHLFQKAVLSSERRLSLVSL